ncbi:STAS domain-containing protein [Actinomadura hibisca]|uniref:STAS domain-containing protein n=1 Tax=Actinomadura hibisca TaxID=68565 RepID=UPI0008374826|nr:STAS domain-containing protein [Actinomadura hibisca]
MDDSLKLSTRYVDTALTIAVAGDLDFATAQQLLGCLDSVLAQLARQRSNGNGVGTVERLDIDTSGITFIDAYGLGVLVTLRNRARGHRLPLRLTAVPPAVHRLLTITGTRDQFLSGSENGRDARPRSLS